MVDFELNETLRSLDTQILSECSEKFAEIDRISEVNSLRVLKSFIDNKVAIADFSGTSGYGYDDRGRDNLDRVFADAVGAEDAICRPQFMSGTHAITVALFGMLRAGDVLLSVTGSPYDTLRTVVGLEGEGYGSLKDYGVIYKEIELKEDGSCDLERVAAEAPKATVVYIQRSRGYNASRISYGRNEIEPIIKVAKQANPNVKVMVDNCYGEYCEECEPCSYGADIIIGSLIKNPGGGIADTGGYIAGTAECVEKCAHRLTAPGTGKEIGCWPAGYKNLYLGVFMGPEITANAVKTGIYTSLLMEKLGYKVNPAFNEKRNDITTSIEFRDEAKLIKFVQKIQTYSPVDSFAVPEPWEMPGYNDKVIMAAGAFTGGSSIELSCDAPIRDPYTAYMQGGLNFKLSRFCVLKAVEDLI